MRCYSRHWLILIVYPLRMRDEGREGLRETGLITFFSWKKGGLLREEGVFEKGSFVDYLRYFTKFEPSEQGQFF